MQAGSTLPRFVLLYSALFAAFGVASPFLPGLLQQDGLGPNAIGIVLASGTAIRLLAGPVGGRLADRTGRPGAVLAGFTTAAALVGTGYAPARGLPLLLLVGVIHAAVLAPLTPIADALTLGSSRARPGFEYGTVRAAGSAAFIAGTLISGLAVGWTGLGVIVWMNAGLLAVAALAARRVPDRMAGSDAAAAATAPTTSQAPARPPHAAWSLLRIAAFRRLMIVVALIGGSHVLHDVFAVIRWRAAGLSAWQCSVLWAMAVGAEVVVFLRLGPILLRRLGPARAMMLSAAAGLVRWSTTAQTAAFPVMAVVEPLHGLSFALLHLSCMEMISRLVPADLAATAQAFYSTVALGAMSAAITLAAGPLYGGLGARAFWAMAALCALALPLAHGIRLPDAARPGGDGRPVSGTA